FNTASGAGYSGYKEAVWKLVLSLCILFALAMCFYKAFRPVTVFLVVTFQAAADISKYAAAILSAKIGDYVIDGWNWCAGKGIFTSDKMLLMTLNGGILAVQFIQYTAMALLFYVSLRKIVRDFREKDYEIRRTELLFLLAPAVVSLLICLLLRIIMVTVENKVPRMLYDRYPILIIVLPAILLLSLLSILYGVKLFQDMIYRNKEKNKRIILKNQINNMQGHLEEMERIYCEIRGMKHDMKNTLAVIRQLSVEEHGELNEYLSGLDRTFDRLEMRFRTGNTVSDILLNMKYHEAVRLIPDLKMDTDKLVFPKNLRIHSYDIGIILGNAVDNAIEACRKLKEKEPEADAFIRFASMQKGNILVFTVENSFDGKLVRKPREELPVTDKPDKENHGMGLTNIKNTVEKYQGTMDFMVKDRV
ncbi:MAG: GHKL domain-containing protein, partial [Lachnospiraceae bacterium]|nr:GHKL domain-containing protein [Lachnospiraceae bacterium]